MSDEELYRSGHTRVLRRFLEHGGTAIRKEPLGPDATARLRRERAILALLAGAEGVSREHAGGGDGGPGALHLEDVGGVPLKRLIGAGALTESQVLEVARQTARILAEVHRRGIIHRDINPHNIIVSIDPVRVTLIDFDLAANAGEESVQLPQEGTMAGTLAYMAPEQTGRTGHLVDQRSDLYAFGATLYEMLCGRPPFDGDDPLVLIHHHMATLPQAPAVLAPGTAAVLSDMTMRLLEKEPGRRYQSASGLAHDLERAAHVEPGDPRFTLGERDFALRLAPPPGLIGRQAERVTLQEAFAKASRTGAVLFVSGAPGVGKTALIGELRTAVDGRNGWFVTAKCDQFRRDASSAPVQAMRALGRRLLTEPDNPQFRDALLRSLGANAGLAAEHLPEIALLLGMVPTADNRPERLQERLKERLQRAQIDILRVAVSPQRPLVMVFDDIQWATPEALEFVDALLSPQDAAPGLLLVGAFRDGLVDDTHPISVALQRWEYAGLTPPVLRLANLSQGDTARLIGEMMRMKEADAAALAQALQEHTRGNPYETIELINSLRRDDVITLNEYGWQWHDATIGHYAAHGDIVSLLSAQIDKLPDASRHLMETAACLGGEVSLDLLREAGTLTGDAFEAALAGVLQEAYLTIEWDNAAAGAGTVRFRHDRIQQAAYKRLGSEGRPRAHLALARRLAPNERWSSIAAEQYLPVLDVFAALKDHDNHEERRLAVHLFCDTARRTRTVSPDTALRFLSAAAMLLTREDEDAALLAMVDVERHAALYSLAQLDEADRVFEAIAGRRNDPLEFAAAACIQINSLTNRQRMQEALAIGLDTLRRLGVETPDPDAGRREAGWARIRQWATEAQTQELLREASDNPRVLAIARTISRVMPAALVCDKSATAWLLLESHRLWVEHGPNAPLVCCLSLLPLVLIGVHADYSAAYHAVDKVIRVGAAHGYALETAEARHMFATFSMHWFEPLPQLLPVLHLAREQFARHGDPQYVCFSNNAALGVLRDIAPLASYRAECDQALRFALRCGNMLVADWCRAHRLLLRALCGRDDDASDAEGDVRDDPSYPARVRAVPTIALEYHVASALSAAIFGQAQLLALHAQDALASVASVPAKYATALAHVLHALALCRRLQEDAAQSGATSATLPAELEAQREWLAQRSREAPANFAHLAHWIDAECHWATGARWEAAAAFDRARNDLSGRTRPWHLALITERSALFYLAQGLEDHGRSLMAAARAHYLAWGASEKIAQLDATYPEIGAAAQAAERHEAKPRSTRGSSSLGSSASAIDVLGVLRASQALSSETTLDRLRERVATLLGEMTGATAVSIALWMDEERQWRLLSSEGATALGIEDAGKAGLLPVAAFRYVERTRESLLVEDAVRDERFAGDPYFSQMPCCSLMYVPIDSRGTPRAVVLLENRLNRGAFGPDRQDAVMLIAGQLAVSLDNALFYQSLERKVQERTLALTRFLAVASHDLRQPMQAMNLYLDAFSYYDLPDPARPVLGKIKECANILSDMFAALLDLSRIDAKEVRPHIEHFAVASLLDRTAVEFTPQAAAKGLTLKIARCSAWAESDPTLIEQVLRNLVANAIRYTKTGTILIGCRRKGTLLRLAVIDTGVGIPADQQDRIFDEFCQLGNRERNSSKGLGLGLAIVKRLGALLSAPITVVSEPGRGSMFAIDIPRGEMQVASAPPDEDPALARPLAGKLVVVVDDDTNILMAMRILLEQWGGAIVTAASGREAMEKSARMPQKPDLIICDSDLGGRHETGADVIAALREVHNATIPALMITGTFAPAHRGGASTAGFPVMHKPINPSALRDLLLQLA